MTSVLSYFISEFLVSYKYSDLEVSGLCAITMVLFLVIRPVSMIHLRKGTQGGQWHGLVCFRVKQTVTGRQIWLKASQHV